MGRQRGRGAQAFMNGIPESHLLHKPRQAGRQAFHGALSLAGFQSSRLPDKGKPKHPGPFQVPTPKRPVQIAHPPAESHGQGRKGGHILYSVHRALPCRTKPRGQWSQKPPKPYGLRLALQMPQGHQWHLVESKPSAPSTVRFGTCGCAEWHHWEVGTRPLGKAHLDRLPLDCSVF